MKSIGLFFTMAVFVNCAFSQNQKAPAFPLITHDPYFSIWSTTDQLNAAPTRHWTGTNHSLTGFLKADGEVFQFMGAEEERFDQILPAGDEANYSIKYIENQPANDWMTEGFDDHGWKSGAAPVGNIEGVSKTLWESRDIWVRRAFELNDNNLAEPFLKLECDDDVTVFLNGELIYSASCCAMKYLMLPMAAQVKSKLKKGSNVLAIHVVNTGGGALLDVGIVQKSKIVASQNIKLAQQKQVQINATQTIYDFSCGKVDLHLTFTSPLLINDLNVMSRPISYVTSAVKSNDGKAHNVALDIGVSTDIATNSNA